jgi:hypothetical protein
MSEMSDTVRRFPTYLPSGWLHTDEIADEIERLTTENKILRDGFRKIVDWAWERPDDVAASIPWSLLWDLRDALEAETVGELPTGGNDRG